MVQSNASDVGAYLAEIPEERRVAISAVRDVILANLPDGFVEGLHFGMISYVVPLSRYPETYNGAPLLYAALASQKNHMALYLTCLYSDRIAMERFAAAHRAAGKRVDMGKSCIRFRTLGGLLLDEVAATIARTSVDGFIALYEAGRRESGTTPGGASARR